MKNKYQIKALCRLFLLICVFAKVLFVPDRAIGQTPQFSACGSNICSSPSGAYVGIGLSSPGQPLEVNGSGFFHGYVVSPSGFIDSNTGGGLRIASPGSGDV